MSHLFANMKLQNKIMIVVCMTVVLSTGIVGGFTIRDTMRRASADMEATETAQISRLRKQMQDMVNASLSTLEKTYNRSVTAEAMKVQYGTLLHSLLDIPFATLRSEYDGLQLPDDMREAVRRSMIQGAKLRAMESIRSMRFGTRGYFWISDTSGRMIMHPVFPDLEGKDMTDLARDGVPVTSEGSSTTPLFEEFVRASGDSSSGGLLIYEWPDPEDRSTWLRRIGYVRLFEPWNWIIGTGVFVDKVEKRRAQKHAKEFVRGIHYGNGNGLFLLDAEGNALAQGICRPGKSRYGFSLRPDRGDHQKGIRLSAL